MAELSLLVKATVILAAALVAARGARQARASVRALLFASAFGVLLLLPVASVLIPPRAVQLPAGAMDLSTLVVEPVPLNIVSTASPPAVALDQAGTRFRLPGLTTMARAGWAAGALLFAAPMLVALSRLRGMRRDALPWLEGRALVEDVVKQAGVTRRVDVFLHEALAAPMTCGLWRPAVGLPIDAPEWTEAELRHALVHELEHVRRRDWPVHLLARLACSLYWFHPLAWIAWRQLCLESERACDDAVLRGAEGTAYAEQLVMLARRISKHSPLPMLSMADRSNLATRVTAVLDGHLARGRTGVVATIIIVTAAAAATLAISPLQATTTVATPAQSPVGGSRPTFEVASIKPNSSGTLNQTITLNGNTFIARNVTLRDLVAHAYNLRNPDQLSGGPGWTGSERYDVEAKPDAAASWGEQMLMLQALLADRFQLRVRRETRDAPAYALVVSQNGSKLKAAADPDCVGPPSATCGGFSTRPGRFVGRRVTLAQVATLLSSRSGRQVLDRTELRGFFDVELEWAAEPSPGPPPDGPNAAAVDPSVPSLFTALQEKLGLRLQPTTAPMEYFVVEAAQRPTPNDAPAAQPQATAPLAFEVASIRRSTSESISGATRPLPDGFSATNVSLRTLIFAAYRIPNRQIIGEASWIDDVRYDIAAKAAGNPSPDQVNVMLRSLLRDRFRLEVHPETRDFDVYALVLARADGRLGPGLRPSAIDCNDPAARAKLASAPFDPEARPVCGLRTAAGRFVAGSTTLSSLASGLMNASGRTVLDRTGLTGRFDIDLEWAPTPEKAGVSVFTAVQEQLGLRLESARAPLDVLVIDRVELPTPN